MIADDTALFRTDGGSLSRAPRTSGTSGIRRFGDDFGKSSDGQIVVARARRCREWLERRLPKKRPYWSRVCSRICLAAAFPQVTRISASVEAGNGETQRHQGRKGSSRGLTRRQQAYGRNEVARQKVKSAGAAWERFVRSRWRRCGEGLFRPDHKSGERHGRDDEQVSTSFFGDPDRAAGWSDGLALEGDAARSRSPSFMARAVICFSRPVFDRVAPPKILVQQATKPAIDLASFNNTPTRTR